MKDDVDDLVHIFTCFRALMVLAAGFLLSTRVFHNRADHLLQLVDVDFHGVSPRLVCYFLSSYFYGSTS